jgi:uncharacterized protein (TIGR00251 family)
MSAPRRPQATDAPADAGAQRPLCLTRRGEGLLLDVIVSPNARRTRADGLHDGALRVRLVAPPVDGKANALLLDWLAVELGLPRRCLRLVRGETARRKQIALEAADEEEVARRLAAMQAGA